MLVWLYFVVLATHTTLSVIISCRDDCVAADVADVAVAVVADVVAVIIVAVVAAVTVVLGLGLAAAAMPTVRTMRVSFSTPYCQQSGCCCCY